MVKQSSLIKKFIFLKARFELLNNGKILIKHYKKNVYKNKNKIKYLIQNNIDDSAVFNSIIGYLKHFNSYITMQHFKEFRRNEYAKKGILQYN